MHSRAARSCWHRKSYGSNGVTRPRLPSLPAWTASSGQQAAGPGRASPVPWVSSDPDLSPSQSPARREADRLASLLPPCRNQTLGPDPSPLRGVTWRSEYTGMSRWMCDAANPIAPPYLRLNVHSYGLSTKSSFANVAGKAQYFLDLTCCTMNVLPA